MCVSQRENYISQRENPFNTENQGIQNLATGAQLNKKASQFSLNMIPVGESAYVELQKGRLEDKSGQLFGSIPKTGIPTKLSTRKKKQYIKRNNSLHAKY